MSLDDVKKINWKHLDMKVIPQYLLISAALIVVGVLCIIVGFLV